MYGTFCEQAYTLYRWIFRRWTDFSCSNNKQLFELSHEKTFFQKMRLMILEQKYLEMLEDGETHEALDCLRKHMTPLKPNDEHVRQLTS